MIRTVIISLAVVLGLGGLFMLTQDGEKNSAPTASSPTKLSMQTVKSATSQGGQLIDVRTAPEYASGHIEGAVNLSLQALQAGSMPKVPKDEPVYVYCQSGNRSGQAAAILKAAGYQNVIDLGAISHVQSLGGVIET